MLGLFSRTGKTTRGRPAACAAAGVAVAWSWPACRHLHRTGEDGGFTLGPLDLCLRPGQVVFVVGGNGSGKTTLAKLLTGLYAPEAAQFSGMGNP